MKTDYITVFSVIHNGKSIEYCLKTVPNELKTFQSLVQGHIEVLSVKGKSRPLDLVCNDEGKLEHLPVTAVMIHEGKIYDTINGPFFVCSSDEEGDFCDCPADDLVCDYVNVEGIGLVFALYYA